MARSVPCLDLLARIRCQQGRWAEAAVLWSNAARFEPDNTQWPELAADARRREGSRLPHDRIALFWLGALLMAIVATGAVMRQGGRGDDTGGDEPVASVPNAAIPASVHKAQRDPSLPELRIPGAEVGRQGGDLIVKFERGLFGRGAELSDDGDAVIRELGRQLQSGQLKFVATVIGHTDDRAVVATARYRDNTALALARAAAVADALHRAGLRPDQIRARAAGGTEYPFPNDSPESRRSNRTVVLRVSPPDVPDENPR